MMAKLIARSQSSLVLPQLQPHAISTARGLSFINYGGVTVSSCYKPPSTTKSGHDMLFLTSSSLSQRYSHLHKGIGAAPVSGAPSLDIDEDVNKPDASGGGHDEGSGNDGNGGGGDGSGGGGGDSGGGAEGGEGSDEADAKKNKALLMSQKFTLAYAALVGFGGLMGYLKSGSQQSLASGGLSALLLYYVYTELPKRPVFASAVGLGLSAALLVVMGSRFKRSGKVFPAGVVSVVSVIMTGGYMHGIMKTAH